MFHDGIDEKHYNFNPVIDYNLNNKAMTCSNKHIYCQVDIHSDHSLVSLLMDFACGRQESDTTEQLHFHFSLSCIGEGNGNPLRCSCLENLRDGGAWWTAVYGVAQSRTWLKWLSSSSWVKVMLKILQAPASAVCELRTSRCTNRVYKRQRNQRSNCQHSLDCRESKGIPEKQNKTKQNLLHWLCFWLCG